MTGKHFADKILRITPRYWAYIIKGERNLCFEKAKIVAGLFGTSSDLWINPEAVPHERKTAWENFKGRMEK